MPQGTCMQKLIAMLGILENLSEKKIRCIFEDI